MTLIKSATASKLASYAASLFLGACMVVGVAVNTGEARAVEAGTNSICSTWNGVDACQSAATNCFCEIVITPEEEKSL